MFKARCFVCLAISFPNLPDLTASSPLQPAKINTVCPRSIYARFSYLFTALNRIPFTPLNKCRNKGQFAGRLDWSVLALLYVSASKAILTTLQVSDSRDAPQNAPRRPPGLRFISVDNVLAGRSDVSSAEARIPANRRVPSYPPNSFRPSDPRGGTNIRTRSTKLSEKLVLLVGLSLPCLFITSATRLTYSVCSQKQSKSHIGDTIPTQTTGHPRTASFEAKNSHRPNSHKRPLPSAFPRSTAKTTFLELRPIVRRRDTGCNNVRSFSKHNIWPERNFTMNVYTLPITCR